MSKKKRLLSGIQPTGKLHLGNYLGAISNWVEMQDDYDAFYAIVDLHSLTTVYENPDALRNDKDEMALDLLACGVDPEKCCLFIQSEVPAHAELHLILSMVTPLPWLTRVPNYKGKIDDLKDKDLNTYGFLGYPVLMASDILLYQADIVPVGKDQQPHLELAREIGRRFNHLYNYDFPIPEDKLTEVPTLLGTDGRKMSKSYGNTIPITATKDDVQKKVMGMFTDPNRKRREDPGNPHVCPVFSYHQLFNSQERINFVEYACSTAKIGCVDCKKECAEKVIEALKPFREKRQDLEKDPGYVKKIFKEGTKRANDVAQDTLQGVKKAIGL